MNLNGDLRQATARRDRASSQRGLHIRWTAVRGAPRVIALGLLILAIFLGFGRRLWYLQFVKGEDYRTRAEQQSTRRVTVPAPRGLIYDRSGNSVVRNVPSFYVTVVPAYLPDDEEKAEDVLVRLAVLLNMPYTESEAQEGEEEPTPSMREAVPYTYTASSSALSNSSRPLVVKRGVERDKALLVAQEASTLPGVSVKVKSVRKYPYGPLLSQVLGYSLPVPDTEEYREQGYDPSTDRIGRAGIEATFEDVLRGEKGEQVVEEDVFGQVIRVVEVESVPVAGDNVHLTIDLELQKFVEEALRQGMSRPKVNSPRGMALVMNPQTGEILSMVSLPTYDNNVFTQGVSEQDWNRWHSDPHRPLINHAVTDGLPPGSVFKIVVASGALQEGIVTPRTRLNCPGKIIVPNKYYPNDPGRAQPFYCWYEAGHGALDVVGGLAHSCDIFFYKIGGGFEEADFEGLGVEHIAEYAQMFGFGEPTGVELPAEIGGVVPSSEWKRHTIEQSWSTGDTYNLSIGQGYLSVTPLQMLNAVNVIANGGTLYRPQVVHHITDAQGEVKRSFEPEIIRTLPISKEHLSLVKQGMADAVDYGTSQRAQIENIRVAGKTGTAQYCDEIAQKEGICGVGYEQPEHAWFTAFAPVEDPEVSVIVFIYNGGEGSEVAAPVAQDILEYYFGLIDEESESESAS